MDSKEYWQKYYKENKDKILEKNSEWNKNNKEKLKIARKKYYEENKEKINENRRKWRINNKEKDYQYHKKWANNNREKIRICRNIRNTKKRITILQEKLKQLEKIKEEMYNK